ncbi:MAG TPA: hypothetical protein VGF32_23350 [Streptosporangiaceae bacterium]|jgi:hypothetical protein
MRGTWQGSGTWKSTGGGGGGLVLVLVVVAALAIGSGAVSAAVSALVTIVIVIACLAVAAVAGGIALLVYRARSDRPGRPLEAPVVSRIGPGSRPQLSEPYKMAATEIRHGMSDLAPEIGHVCGQFEPEIRQQLTDLRAIEPPQLHLHFHGLNPAEVAEAIRQASEDR